MQITTKQDELQSAQAGLRQLEHSLDETHAGKQADRQEFIQRVQYILSQKGLLEKQLHVHKGRIADTQSSTVAAKLSALNRRLAATQHQRALTERRLKEKQVPHATPVGDQRNSSAMKAARFAWSTFTMLSITRESHLQMELEQSEQNTRKELVSLQRKVRQTEKRALNLMQTKIKQSSLLEHRAQQLKHIMSALRTLQARIFLAT
jgi:hypothetical protein